MFQLGFTKFISDKSWTNQLRGKRVAFLGHQASVSPQLDHHLELLGHHPDINLTAGFGPQHGIRGEKQDNMIESSTFIDSKLNIPIFSLYGEVRYPTAEMMDTFDVILVDLQDVGCRIYTFLTTLFYVLKACNDTGKTVWVLDRPNPAGRAIEGLTLNMEFESFVGAAPTAMRHGLTLGEAALWYKEFAKLDVDLQVVPMEGFLKSSAHHAWPIGELPWVNPSPNLPRLNGVECYGGTVLVEGTWLSEGRGTTTPLEVLGGPGMDGDRILKKMADLGESWMQGCLLRSCFFEPTFQKHAKALCGGFQIHTDYSSFNTMKFKPYRLVSLAFKAIRNLYPDFELWREPPYEYEKIKMPIDILSGGEVLREWVDDKNATCSDLEELLVRDEKAWEKQSSPFFLY